MSTDPTEFQDAPERRRACDLSLKQGHPPAQVPGYEPERFLGVGAYGEVWVAVERNTGRRVAIKFYAHRGGLDWSLLAREVEKLAFLFADRYVVQLLGVGWDSDPPYYVMEYLEQGSLADRLAARGPLPVKQAVALFQEVATGLLHAHGKGVLHCDLKPANVLLDQDDKPRLADFGQSRLSHEQTPALGTMFYMAPEQADLNAVPDARWDVYALGALLHCMLTGRPPYRNSRTEEQLAPTPDLNTRLTHYRQMIVESPPPTDHHRVRGVDAMLAAIVDRCLAVDPEQRFPNVQAVIDALHDRAARIARRPTIVLGAVLPALLLAVVVWFAWQGFSTALEKSNAALTRRALESNEFASQYVARAVANELERRFQVVEQLAGVDRFQHAVQETLAQPELRALLVKLSDPALAPDEREKLREQFRQSPQRQALQQQFAALIPPGMEPRGDEDVSSWFFCDAHGVSTLRVPEGQTIGRNYAWRAYFSGGAHDQEENWRPPANEHLEKTSLTDVFRSQATAQWIVAICTPVYDESVEPKRFLGVVAMTASVGRFVPLPGGDDQFAVLVNNREGKWKGVILQHPLFDELLASDGRLPDRLKDYRLEPDQLPDTLPREMDYHDPLGKDELGSAFDRHWLARMEPIRVRDEDINWLAIVQESYQSAIGNTLDELSHGLIHAGRLALLLIALLMAALWALAKRLDIAR